MKFKSIKPNMIALLHKYEALRDNNPAMVMMYYKDYHNVRFDASFFNVMKHISDKSIPSISSLERMSRQVQEQYPELRTEKWYERKGMEIPTQRDLGYNI